WGGGGGATARLRPAGPWKTGRSPPRRELSPAWARILLSLSLAMALAADDCLGRAQVGNHQLAVHARQVADVAQTKGDEELARRLVEERPTGCVLAAGHADEPSFEQVVEHGVGAHAAYGVELGLRQGLLVGDDRQRLQRRPRQPYTRAGASQTDQPRRQLGARDHPVTAAHLHDRQAAWLGLVAGHELADQIAGG